MKESIHNFIKRIFCQNGTNTMSEQKWKETLVEHTPLDIACI